MSPVFFPIAACIIAALFILGHSLKESWLLRTHGIPRPGESIWVPAIDCKVELLRICSRGGKATVASVKRKKTTDGHVFLLRLVEIPNQFVAFDWNDIAGQQESLKLQFGDTPASELTGCDRIPETLLTGTVIV